MCTLYNTIMYGHVVIPTSGTCIAATDSRTVLFIASNDFADLYSCFPVKMPTIVIRPHTDWPETVISDPNATAFWKEIDAYWARTMDQMGEAQNRTGEEVLDWKEGVMVAGCCFGNNVPMVSHKGP